MQILIEIKGGQIVKSYSNNKDANILILDHDSQKEIPDLSDCFCEYMPAKDMRNFIDEQLRTEDMSLDNL